MMKLHHDTILRMLQITCGTLLLLAAFGKMVTPVSSFEGFREQLPLVSVEFIKVLFILLVTLESCLGIAWIFVGRSRLLRLKTLITLTIVFIFVGVAIGRYYLSAGIGCSCFGIFGKYLPGIEVVGLILLIITSLSIALIVFNPQRRTSIILLGSIVIFIGHVVFALANDVPRTARLSLTAITQDGDDWFGIPIMEFGGETVREIVDQNFGRVYTVCQVAERAPAWAVLGPRSTIQGWVVLLAVPSPHRGQDLLKISMVYDNRVALRFLRVKLPDRLVKTNAELIKSSQLYFSGLASMDPRFLLYGIQDSLWNGDPLIAAAVVDVINMTTHRLLLRETSADLVGVK